MPSAPVFGLSDTHVTKKVWPFNVSKHLPETVLQTFAHETVLQSFALGSMEAVSTRSPSEMKAAAVTGPS